MRSLPAKAKPFPVDENEKDQIRMKRITEVSRRHYASPGLVVMGGDSGPSGCGFEYRHRILDGHIYTYIVVKTEVFV